MSVRNRDELSMAYTPGVARICLAIGADKKLSHKLGIGSLDDHRWTMLRKTRLGSGEDEMLCSLDINLD